MGMFAGGIEKLRGNVSIGYWKALERLQVGSWWTAGGQLVGSW